MILGKVHTRLTMIVSDDAFKSEAITATVAKQVIIPDWQKKRLW